MSEQADSAQSNPILSIILAGIGLMGVAAVFLPADLVPQLTQSAPTEETKPEACKESLKDPGSAEDATFPVLDAACSPFR